MPPPIPRRRVLALAFLAGLAAAPAAPAAAAKSDPVATWVALQIAREPLVATELGLPGGADRLPDRTPSVLARQHRTEDQLRVQLRRSAPEGRDDETAILAHELEVSRRRRICRLELWQGVNHMGGWQASFPGFAANEAFPDAASRGAAARRWTALPGFVDVEIANLRRGLALGYSAPQPVVRRVISQLDGLLASSDADLAFYAPLRGAEAAFTAAHEGPLRRAVRPALRRYRDFLADTYLPRARLTLGLSELPQGQACYRALLYSQTTLDTTAEVIAERGRAAVAENVAAVAQLGQEAWGAPDFDAAVARLRDAPENRFADAEAYAALARRALGRMETTRSLFAQWPRQSVEMRPIPAFKQGSGATASYSAEPDPDRPAVFYLPLDEWRAETVGNAEVTVAHETWPGHHLQMSLAARAGPATAFARLSQNAAFIEGWARYAEGLAEEAGAYGTVFAKITRRVWSARGMVLDTGVHAQGWTREQAVAYAMASGRFNRERAEALVDRVAADPAQLTAYDSGGLEIRRLRAEAQAALGARFDLRAFHDELLSGGVAPLPVVRRRIEAWVCAQGGDCARRKFSN